MSVYYFIEKVLDAHNMSENDVDCWYDYNSAKREGEYIFEIFRDKEENLEKLTELFRKLGISYEIEKREEMLIDYIHYHPIERVFVHTKAEDYKYFSMLVQLDCWEGLDEY